MTWSPGPDERHALPHALDDAGALVAEDARRVPGRVGARGRVEVGVADAAGGEPDEHLAGLRLREVDLLDDERLPELLEHGGADPHAGDPTRRRGAGRVRDTPSAHPFVPDDEDAHPVEAVGEREADARAAVELRRGRSRAT